MSDVFISYKSEDRERVAIIARGLEAEGFDVWWDSALRGGETYDEVIERELAAAKVVVVLWSPQSVGSRWVRSEATVGDRQGKLVPATIEPCRRPLAFELAHTSTLDHWRGDPNDPHWRRFVDDVRARRDGKAPKRGGVKTQTRPQRTKPPSSPFWPLAALLGGGVLFVAISVVAYSTLIRQLGKTMARLPVAGLPTTALEDSPLDLTLYMGKWSRTDPDTCAFAMQTSIDDAPPFLAVTHADGRKEVFMVEQTKVVFGMRVAIRTKPNPPVQFQLWTSDSNNKLHLAEIGGQSERVWTRCTDASPE
ncbi:MAG: toll/interleukin-1 receptor domain-containing protein [Myxococcota bacterium]